ncbi:Expansin-B3 [Platanthera guangdongensis]|uniref:Expansin-B3 n=1 Tax=Platanthera guangdongensis TaxID=2320717 RepID=A0ABR2N2K8_9ASPA
MTSPTGAAMVGPPSSPTKKFQSSVNFLSHDISLSLALFLPQVEEGEVLQISSIEVERVLLFHRMVEAIVVLLFWKIVEAERDIAESSPELCARLQGRSSSSLGGAHRFIFFFFYMKSWVNLANPRTFIFVITWVIIWWGMCVSSPEKVEHAANILRWKGEILRWISPTRKRWEGRSNALSGTSKSSFFLLFFIILTEYSETGIFSTTQPKSLEICSYACLQPCLLQSTSTEWQGMKHLWGANWCIIGGPFLSEGDYTFRRVLSRQEIYQQSGRATVVDAVIRAALGISNYSTEMTQSTSTEWQEMKHLWGANWCIIGGPFLSEGDYTFRRVLSRQEMQSFSFIRHLPLPKFSENWIKAPRRRDCLRREKKGEPGRQFLNCFEKWSQREVGMEVGAAGDVGGELVDGGKDGWEIGIVEMEDNRMEMDGVNDD